MLAAIHCHFVMHIKMDTRSYMCVVNGHAQLHMCSWMYYFIVMIGV